MRYGPGQKEQTRERILEAAGRVFRRRGYHAAGIDEVMREAGLTAGGFYAHFGSKEALLTETLTYVGSTMAAQLQDRLGGLSGREWLIAFIDRYLSPVHRGNLEGGCPIAALLSDLARSGEPARESFEGIFQALAAMLSRQAAEDGFEDDRDLAVLVLCIGGLGLARSIRDAGLGDRILASCARLAKESCASPEQRLPKVS